MPSGILLVDKPQGLSSNAVLQRVKRAYRADKAGHVGSLDPLATGMLPICLDEATKIAGEIVSGRKRYEFSLRLGARTTTGDAAGEVTERLPVPAVDDTRLRELAQSFVGEHRQVPPMYSALKKDGRPLYELARQGVVVERAARPITIHALEPLGDWQGSGEPLFAVECSKGTYVRTLAEDMAAALGTVGHVGRLHRTWVEPFEKDPMHSLEACLALAPAGGGETLLPLERGLRGWGRLRLDAVQVQRLRQGQALSGMELTLPGGHDNARKWLLEDPVGTGVGWGEFDEFGSLRPRRIFNL